MKCEACDGDGLIEAGAYRGDKDNTNTRPCQLCGGVVTGTVVDVKVATSPSAVVLSKLSHSASEAGTRFQDLTVSISGTTMTRNHHGFYESKNPVPLPARKDDTKEIGFERTTSARNADNEMNKFLRDNFRD